MIRPGQVYESCSGDGRRIRVVGDPWGGRVDAATVAASGRLLRRRSILTAQLHASATTQDGKARRTGYRLTEDPETPMPDPHPLVAALRDRRRALGLSQNAVAAALGLTQACVSRYESGQRTPGLHSVQAYAAAVGPQLGLAPAETQAATP